VKAVDKQREELLRAAGDLIVALPRDRRQPHIPASTRSSFADSLLCNVHTHTHTHTRPLAVVAAVAHCRRTAQAGDLINLRLTRSRSTISRKPAIAIITNRYRPAEAQAGVSGPCRVPFWPSEYRRYSFALKPALL
jgi:hypothetical protein